ncbi:hypothetical protein MTYP_01744 [Methylophilaceae bacterium]|nr:hypothetical protein MTYP_01744 [Methylophilaceae bacterium]
MMKKHSQGFSLVEVMVGLAIGMLGMIVVMQVLSLTQASNRTTTSGADAQQVGALALYSLERDVRQAGFGFNVPGFLGCELKGFDKNRGEAFDFTFTPVVITQIGADEPDIVEINYGSSAKLAVPTNLTQSMSDTTSTYRVANRFGFTVGDILVGAESGKKCGISQVTGLPAAPDSNAIVHASVASGRYNPAGGLSPAADYTYSTNGKLYNIGPNPVSNVYTVTDRGLEVLSNFTGEIQLVAEGVVDMQADYGVDTNNDNAVDTYLTDPDTNGDGTITDVEWGKVLSIRLGIVARSRNREAGCDATTTLPSWVGGTFNAVEKDSDWQCYRYRVFETTSVLRNMVWRPL